VIFVLRVLVIGYHSIAGRFGGGSEFRGNGTCTVTEKRVLGYGTAEHAQIFTSIQIKAITGLVNRFYRRLPLRLIGGLVAAETLLGIYSLFPYAGAVTVASFPRRSTASQAFVLLTFASASNTNPCSRSTVCDF
jgi:hypothetical protein